MCNTASPPIWTVPELRRRGLTPRRVARAVAHGRLIRVRRGVYAAPGACTATLDAAAHGGSIACRTAAEHHGLWLLPEPAAGLDRPHIWLRPDRHQYPHPDCRCVVHWQPGAGSAFGIPSIELTLVQLYRCRGAEFFFVALESARNRGLLSTAGLLRLRDAVDAAGQDLVDFSRDDADSGLESLIRLRLRRFGLRVQTQAFVVGTGRVDLLIDGWLILEADGREIHDGPPLRHKDLVRDANAAAWGHVTLRFDYAMILFDGDLVERAILGTLARHGGRMPPQLRS